MNPYQADQNHSRVALFAFFFHFFLINTIYFTIRKLDLWYLLKIHTMQPGYADLRAYTSQVSCLEQGIDYRLETCDPFGRQISFLQVWVPIFKFLHLNDSKTVIIGNSLQLGFLIAVYCLAYSLKIDIAKARNFIPLALILLSPPIALLIERGQTEMFFYTAITACAVLIYRGLNFVAFLILGFLSILKIYPLILILSIMLNRQIKKNRRDLILGLSILSVGTLSMFYFRDSVFQMTQASVSQGFYRTFGLKNFPYLIEVIINKLFVTEDIVSFGDSTIQIIGLLVFGTAIIVVLVAKRLGKLDTFKFPVSHELVPVANFVFMTMVFISYFVISSYDYRMLYFIPVFLCYLKMSNNSELKSKAFGFPILILLFMWGQFDSIASALFQPILLFFISSVAVKTALEIIKMYKLQVFSKS